MTDDYDWEADSKACWALAVACKRAEFLAGRTLPNDALLAAVDAEDQQSHQFPMWHR